MGDGVKVGVGRGAGAGLGVHVGHGEGIAVAGTRVAAETSGAVSVEERTGVADRVGLVVANAVTASEIGVVSAVPTAVAT